MKKLVGMIVLALVSVACSGGLTAPTMYGYMEGWVGDQTWDCAASDTIRGADTLTFTQLTKREFEPGYEYAIRMDVVTPAADSIQLEYLSYGTDGSTLIEQAMFDTVGASATNRTAVLPFGKTVLTNKATIRFIGWIADKTTTFNRIEVWKRKLSR